MQAASQDVGSYWLRAGEVYQYHNFYLQYVKFFRTFTTILDNPRIIMESVQTTIPFLTSPQQPAPQTSSSTYGSLFCP